MAAKKTTANQEQKSKKAEPVSHKPDYSTHIVVKFQDYVDLPYHKGVEKQIEEFRVGPWKKLAKEHPGISIQPLFGNINQDKLKGLVAKARQMDPTYKGGDFFRYFRVTCPVESDPGEILGELSSWNNVRNAYFKPVHIAPGLVNYGNNPQANAPAPYQDYLDLAPAGISAKYVWDAGTPGSDGTEINFIDVEKGWKLDHSDLPSPAITLISGNNLDASKSHGTSVLGIICAVDNIGKMCRDSAKSSRQGYFI